MYDKTHYKTHYKKKEVYDYRQSEYGSLYLPQAGMQVW